MGTKGKYDLLVVSQGKDATPDTGKYASSIKINGAGTNPVCVIDGKQTDVNGLNHLDPKDIESITILKDKTAVAMYGANATNGVIIVTTKKAKLNQILLAPKTDYTPPKFEEKN